MSAFEPQGVFVDQAGFILEGPNSNFAMLTKDNVFVTPPFDNILPGVTIQRLMELLPEVCFAHAPLPHLHHLNDIITITPTWL